MRCALLQRRRQEVVVAQRLPAVVAVRQRRQQRLAGLQGDTSTEVRSQSRQLQNAVAQHLWRQQPLPVQTAMMRLISQRQLHRRHRPLLPRHCALNGLRAGSCCVVLHERLQAPQSSLQEPLVMAAAPPAARPFPARNASAEIEVVKPAIPTDNWLVLLRISAVEIPTIRKWSETVGLLSVSHMQWHRHHHDSFTRRRAEAVAPVQTCATPCCALRHTFAPHTRMARRIQPAHAARHDAQATAGCRQLSSSRAPPSAAGAHTVRSRPPPPARTRPPQARSRPRASPR